MMMLIYKIIIYLVMEHLYGILIIQNYNLIIVNIYIYIIVKINSITRYGCIA